MSDKYSNFSASDFLKQKNSQSPSSSPAPVSSSTRSSTKSPYAGVSASDFLASKSSPTASLNPLVSDLRVTPDKWNSVNGAYEAYENNRNSPNFVYDENVNRNQYNSIKSLMGDIDADIAFYRQQGENITADNLQYNKEQLQENLDKLDKEYNDNKAPEAAAFQGIDNSIQKTLGSASEYSQQASDLESQIAELERTNHRGVIRQDTDAVSGEQYDVYGNVNDEALHQLREQLQNTNANKAAAERAEQREALKGNADYAERSAANSPLAENPEAQRLIGGRAIDAVSGQEYTEQSAIDLLGYASDDENQMFNYILNTQGEGAAKEYIDDLRYDLNARQASAKSQEKSQAALEHEGAESLKSVGQNLISGAGLFDTAIQNVYRDITGNNRRIDYNTWANQQGQQVQATRGTVAQELTDKYGTKRILGKDVSWGDAYQLGMSMLDSGATAALGGVTGLGGGTAALLGASAGTQAMQEAARDGASDSQALMLGFAAMAAETITEKVSLENLLKAPGKTILTNALRQAGIEASEEAASTVLNELANETVMGEDSDFNKRVREYEANGMSHEEAQQQAWKQFGSQLLWDAIGGAISGGIMGGMAKSFQGDTDTQTQQTTETQTTETNAEQTASTPLAETVNRANQQTAEETPQTAPQNSPLEQTSATETNSPLSETVLNATEAQQSASAPTVSENAENPQGPRPFDMGAAARDVWNQQTQQAEQQTRASTPFSPSYNEQGNGRKVESGLSENIRTDSARDAQIQEMFDEDPQFYNQKINADTLANAKAMLGENFDVDPTDAVSKVRSALDDAKGGMKLKPEVVPATKLVADKLAEQARALEAEGKTTEANAKMDTARGLLADLASELTQAGQLGQAARILRNQGPAVRSQYIHNLVDEFNNSLTKRQSEKISQKQTAEGQEATGQVKVPEELLNTFRDADTPDAQEAALHDIAAYIGKNTPSTFYQKWTNLRFTNMLGNFVTQFRNIFGNAASSANHLIKRRINGNIEKAAKTLNRYMAKNSTPETVKPGAKKVPIQRSFKGRYGASEFSSWWNAFKEDPDIKSATMNGGRYDTVRKLNKGAFGQDIESNQTIYGGRDPASRYLEAKRRLTNWATEQGDVVFQRLNFADAAAGYAKAHGFTFETATDAQKADAIEYAIKEAQEATFHNDTALSDFVTGLHVKENSQLAKKHPGLAKVVNAFGDGLLPFRKTPANILTQAEEFSPLGLINTTVKAVQAKKGNATASDVINSFSKTLTGSGVLGMGMLMRFLGKARASEDDEEKAAYQKMNGEQDYAIKVGDNWLTMDWVAPDSIPFFMGVKLMDIIAERDGFQTEDISQFLGGMTDTFLNMSMLQSVNDTLENLRGFGTDADAMPKLATSLAISYLTQGLGSSLAGRIESAFTPNRQDTYTDPDSPLSSDLQYAVGRLGNKILGYDYQQADYIDAWGNKQKGQGVDNPFARAGLALFSPSYVREDTTTDFDRGLMELHDQLEGTDFKGDVLPKHISRSTIVGDKRLTPEEYEIYATNVGQMRREMAEAFWNSDLRETLSPEEQGKVITDIYEYCASRGKADILDRRGQSLNSNDDWADEVEFFGDDVNRLTKYLATKDAFKDNLSSGNYEAIDSLLKTIDSFTNTDGEFTNADTQYYTKNIQGLEKYILAAKQGVTADMLTEAKDAYNYYNNKEDLSKSEMTTRFTSWVDNNQITEDWTDKQKDAVKSLLKYYNMNPVNTDRYERMGEYGVDSKNISAIESQLETLAKTEGFKDLTSSQQTYKKYDVILKEAATLSDDQALALVRSYGSLGPGAGKLKYMIQQYFGDRDEDFQETLYNSVRDERDWSHNWRRTKPDNPFD